MIAPTISTGGGLSLAQTSEAPCVGYATTTLKPYVACLQYGRWLPVAVDQLSGIVGIFNQLVADRGGGLLVLMHHPRRPQHIVLRLAGGIWRRLGAPLTSRMAIARLAVSDGTSTPPAIAMEEVGRPPFTRTLRVYKNGRWHSRGLALTGLGQGPLTSGPAHVGSRDFLTVTDADRAQDWPFSVYTSRTSSPWSEVGGTPLNKGFGSAQGNLSTVGEEAWVSWQQNTPSPNGMFTTTVYAAQLSAAGGVVREPSIIWRGTNAGHRTRGCSGTARPLGALPRHNDVRGRHSRPPTPPMIRAWRIVSSRL